MSMDLPELKELGLSSGQVKVYAAILGAGSVGIQEIQEKTGLERRAIYDVVNKLIERGLVTFTEEHGRRRYQWTHPRNLYEAVEQKQKALSSLKGKMPQITDLFLHTRPKVGAEVFRGNDGMKALLNEALEHEASYWIGGNSGVEQSTGTGMKLWYHNWMKRRVKLKRLMYDLVDHGTWLEDYPPHDLKKHKKEYYKYCTLPKNLRSPMVIIMFGNKVAQVLWSRHSFAFVLESEEVKESFMKYFHYFWKEPW